MSTGCTFVYDVEQGIAGVDGLEGDHQWVPVTCDAAAVAEMQIHCELTNETWSERVCTAHADDLRENAGTWSLTIVSEKPLAVAG